MTVSAAQQLLVKLSSAVSTDDLNSATSTLRELKICFTTLPALQPGAADSATSQSEREVAMRSYEQAVLLSLKQRDQKSLERHLVLLKHFYFDPTLGPSEIRTQLLGLELMVLLVQNRLAEFHTALELLNMQERSSDPCLSFVIGLERHLMEGSYGKVLAARRDAPVATYAWLLEGLEDTVRDEVASCLEVAYMPVKLETAEKLMHFGSAQQLKDYVAMRDTWNIVDGRIHFEKNEEPKDAGAIPAHQLIKETLEYANELERIV